MLLESTSDESGKADDPPLEIFTTFSPSAFFCTKDKIRDNKPANSVRNCFERARSFKTFSSDYLSYIMKEV